MLYADIYAGSTYGHYNDGTVSSLEKMTLDDVKQFYRMHYGQSNLFLGIAGGFSPAFLEGMKKDFKRCPRARLPPAQQAAGRDRSQSCCHRGQGHALGRVFARLPDPDHARHGDYPAMLLAASYLGQHRMSGGVFYDEMREKRGLNYGDYA